MLINIFRGNRLSSSAFALRNYLRDQGVRSHVFRRMSPFESMNGEIATRADLIVNWGASVGPTWVRQPDLVPRPRHVKVFNGHYPAVGHCINKQTFYERVAQIPVGQWTHLRQRMDTPPHTTSMDTARDWLDDGRTVVERHTLAGSGGDGIRIVEPGDQLTPCQLYVEYIKKSLEYRLHMAQPVYGMPELLHWQQKMRRSNLENSDVDYRVRNHENGWIYATGEGTSPPSDLIVETATRVMSVFPELNYGAVDIGWNRHYNRATVYEINTAPGLVASTVEVLGNYLQYLVSN